LNKDNDKMIIMMIFAKYSTAIT